MEKLNEVSQKLDGLTPGVRQQPPHAEVAPDIESSPSPRRLDLAGSDACLEVLSAYASTDCILTWPIFAGRWPPDLLSRELYSKSFGSGQIARTEESEFPSLKRQKLAINEEDVPELIDRYLHYVYPKNPIFYTPRIRELARHVSEDGFGWDASSCLVVGMPELRPYFRTEPPADLKSFWPAPWVPSLHPSSQHTKAANSTERALWTKQPRAAKQQRYTLWPHAREWASSNLALSPASATCSPASITCTP